MRLISSFAPRLAYTIQFSKINNLLLLTPLLQKQPYYLFCFALSTILYAFLYFSVFFLNSLKLIKYKIIVKVKFFIFINKLQKKTFYTLHVHCNLFFGYYLLKHSLIRFISLHFPVSSQISNKAPWIIIFFAEGSNLCGMPVKNLRMEDSTLTPITES